MEKVFFEICREYNIEEIDKIITSSLEYLEVKIPVSSRILLKPNILGMYFPEQHINTNPVIVEAILRILKNNNNIIILGDSSGNGQYGNTKIALRKSGMMELGKKYGITVKAFDGYPGKIFRSEKNLVFKEINLTSFIDEVDYIINLPKLKSHTFMSYSGAVKNFYGCVPGAGKPRGHLHAPAQKDFANGLLDIYSFIKPKVLLNIMDGIIGIEGAGPGPAGKIKESNFIAVSKDAIALDCACISLFGKNPSNILTNQLGIKRDLFHGNIEKNRELPLIDFKLPKASFMEALLNKVVPGLALSKPYLIPQKCKKCCICVKACPAGAILMNEFPSFNYSKCIYCFCCHENCPESAIMLKENILFKIFKAISK